MFPPVVAKGGIVRQGPGQFSNDPDVESGQKEDSDRNNHNS